MIKRITLIIFIFYLANCENTSDKLLIKEGYGVNIFKIGIKISQSPKEIEGIILMVNRDSIIHYIDIKSSLFHTKDNLKVGEHYETILKHRGMYDTSKVIDKAKSTSPSKNKIPSSMRYDGIIFFLDDKGNIETIRIY